jgi:hypothetical protein
MRDYTANANAAGLSVMAFAVHTTYLVVMTFAAWVVYRRLGVGILRTTWFNVDRAWAAALVVTGTVVLYEALMFQPRTIAGVLALGIALQNGWLFLALSAVLVLGTVVPRRNLFDAAWRGAALGRPDDRSIFEGLFAVASTAVVVGRVCAAANLYVRLTRNLIAPASV